MGGGASVVVGRRTEGTETGSVQRNNEPKHVTITRHLPNTTFTMTTLQKIKVCIRFLSQPSDAYGTAQEIEDEMASSTANHLILFLTSFAGEECVQHGRLSYHSLISTTAQKNKATSYHVGQLKAKIAKLRRELIAPPGGSGGGGGGVGFDVAR
jgi:hypothetical protein